MIRTILRRVLLGWMILIVWPMAILLRYLINDENNLNEANGIAKMFWNGHDHSLKGY